MRVSRGSATDLNRTLGDLGVLKLVGYLHLRVDDVRQEESVFAYAELVAVRTSALEVLKW